MSTRPLPPGRLGERLAEVYLVVGPLYRRVMRRVEQEQPLMGMSVGVRAVLDELRRNGPATVPEVARIQDLSRQFVQRMVNDAMAAGWAEAASNPAHRRSSLIRLTPAGRTAIDAVIRREHSLMSRVGGDLTDADVDTTLRVLREMLTALGELEPTGQSEAAAEHAASTSATPTASPTSSSPPAPETSTRTGSGRPT